MPKNFKRVPQAVLDRLANFAMDDVVAAVVKRLRPGDIETYAHLGLRLVGGQLEVPFVPSATAGRYSQLNLEGKHITRDDLPKTPKEFCFLAPNWRGNGTHLVCHTRMVYPRDFIRPKEPDFSDELLYNLNILQENVGAVDVFEAEAALDDYLETIRVDWEILPVGEVGAPDVVNRLFHRRPPPPDERALIEARLATFRRFRPTHYIAGTSGFARYIGAKYADDFVVFESLRYGNALYVMFERWQELSQKSRIDLLKGDRDGFERIIHREGWEDLLDAMIQRYRERR